MGNINTFEPHLQLANKSRGFRFQSATVLVNTSITKSLVIVLSKCLLLVQFLPRTCSVQTSIRLALLFFATLPTRRISKPVSAGLLDHEHIRVK